MSTDRRTFFATAAASLSAARAAVMGTGKIPTEYFPPKDILELLAERERAMLLEMAESMEESLWG